jgi:hypothetical protein
LVSWCLIFIGLSAVHTDGSASPRVHSQTPCFSCLNGKDVSGRITIQIVYFGQKCFRRQSLHHCRSSSSQAAIPGIGNEWLSMGFMDSQENWGWSPGMLMSVPSFTWLLRPLFWNANLIMTFPLLRNLQLFSPQTLCRQLIALWHQAGCCFSPFTKTQQCLPSPLLTSQEGPTFLAWSELPLLSGRLYDPLRSSLDVTLWHLPHHPGKVRDHSLCSHRT